MGRLVIGLLAGLACRPGPAVQSARADTIRGARESAAPVIRGPTVVAFRLPASDTLTDATMLDDFRNYTELAAPALREVDVELISTTADSVVVELRAGPRRVIMLAGLDYPFGYVLVEPGYAEAILTGVSTDDELLDEVDWYFGVNEEGTDSLPGRDGRPQRVSGRRSPAPAWTASRVRRVSAGRMFSAAGVRGAVARTEAPVTMPRGGGHGHLSYRWPGPRDQSATSGRPPV